MNAIQIPQCSSHQAAAAVTRVYRQAGWAVTVLPERSSP